MSKFSFDTRCAPRDENWAARRQVATRFRVLSEELLRRDLHAESVAACLVPLREIEQRLAACNTLERHASGIGIFTLECSAWTGHSNPLSPPLWLWSDGDCVRAQVEFSAAYEESDAEPWVHRGSLAAVFDHVLGYVQMLAGDAGMTARLQVVHRERVPSRVPLRIESSVTRVDGRRKYCAGKLFVPTFSEEEPERLAVEAEGVFVVPPTW